MLNHNYIGTEHILLGLIHEGEGVAGKALESLGIALEGVRQQVEEIIGQGQLAPSGHIPFTPRAKKVLELSLREALQLGHNYIGTEHILLGLIREGEGVAAQVLVKLGADLNRVRQQVLQQLSGSAGKEPAEGSSGGRGEGTQVSSSVVLDQFGRNLTQSAREGKLDPVIGREREIERRPCRQARCAATFAKRVLPVRAKKREEKRPCRVACVVMPAVPLWRRVCWALVCTAVVFCSVRTVVFGCASRFSRCVRETERLNVVLWCTVPKFAERPTCGEKDRFTCDEKVVRPPPPPTPLTVRPAPPLPDFGGAASAFIGIAKALASNMAVSDPRIFVITSSTVFTPPRGAFY